MNKKLLMGGMLALVAIGAGAFALTNLGSESGEGRAATTARAESLGSSYQPTVFDTEGGYFAPEAAKVAGGSMVRMPDPVTPAPGKHDPAPSVGTGAAAEPDDDIAPADAGETPPASDPVGPIIDIPAGSQDEPASPTILYNDAIVCAIIECQTPQLPHNPQITDTMCDVLNCDDEPVMIDSPVQPCQILGNCPKPTIYDKVKLPLVHIGLR